MILLTNITNNKYSLYYAYNFTLEATVRYKTFEIGICTKWKTIDCEECSS